MGPLLRYVTGSMIAVAAMTSGCERTPTSHGLAASPAAAAQDLFLKLGDATASTELFISAPLNTSSVGVCSLQSETAACDSTVSGYLTATSLGNGRDRTYFRVALGDVNASAVYHAYDSSAKKILGKFRLVDTSADPITTGLSLLNEATLRTELTDMSSDARNGRLSGTPENSKAADVIIAKLKELGIASAKPDSYLQEFTLSVGPMAGKKTANIIATIPGTDPELKNEFVVIGAHMDHAGTLTRGYTCSAGGGNDNICNGADDNGSGTIAVLNAAKALAAVRSSLKRTVVLMWFSGEEEGLLGSRHYVQEDPIFPLEKTVFMINLDMVGYMESNGNTLAALGGGTSDVGERILQNIGRKYPEREISISQQAGGGSDHVYFMREGIPGVFFHTGVSNNPNYHRTGDSPDKVDYAGMLMATKVAFETVLTVANDPGISNRSFAKRAPLVTEEETKQTCHHLILNPNIAEALPDFRNSNDGRP